jgi:hypothetical protein
VIETCKVLVETEQIPNIDNSLPIASLKLLLV